MNLPVLLVGYEAAPFYKKGGLGDVLGALPTTLRGVGVDARIVIPYYHTIKREFPQKKIGEFSFRFGKEDREIKIYQGTIPKTDTPIYFLENQKYLTLVTAKEKRLEEFVFFDLAVCYFMQWLIQKDIWQPRIIHCNDWHTALIPLILQKKLHSSLPSILTIHNLLYQGNGLESVLDLLDIQDTEVKTLRRGEAANELNLLGEGILHASIVSTVSPTYAKEIMADHSRNVIYRYLAIREKEMGKKPAIQGILNGIDDMVWNPSKSFFLKHKYDRATVTEGKQKNKQELLASFSLEDRPTFCFIGRMAAQKGLDTTARALDKLMALDINLLILGKGHHATEDVVRKMAQKYPKNVRAKFVYSEELAHLFHAGSDFLLMPSHYEPCGLVQLVAMRYGTIPVASRTGGLIDTIQDGKTGFLFKSGSVQDLIEAVARARTLYKNQEQFASMRVRCMKQDFSWDKSAMEYKKLYEQLLASSN